MKPIWVKVKWFPLTDGMVLFPFIFLKETRWDKPTRRHELYHWREAQAAWVLPWYAGYIAAWVWYVGRGRSPWDSPYERRAIAAEQDASLDSWGGPEEV